VDEETFQGLNEYVKTTQEKIEKDLVSKFGSKDVVTPYILTKIYTVKCQKCTSYAGRSLESHLVNKHSLIIKTAYMSAY